MADESTTKTNEELVAAETATNTIAVELDASITASADTFYNQDDCDSSIEIIEPEPIPIICIDDVNELKETSNETVVTGDTTKSNEEETCADIVVLKNSNICESKKELNEDTAEKSMKDSGNADIAKKLLSVDSTVENIRKPDETEKSSSIVLKDFISSESKDEQNLNATDESLHVSENTDISTSKTVEEAISVENTAADIKSNESETCSDKVATGDAITSDSQIERNLNTTENSINASEDAEVHTEESAQETLIGKSAVAETLTDNLEQLSADNIAAETETTTTVIKESEKEEVIFAEEAGNGSDMNESQDSNQLVIDEISNNAAANAANDEKLSADNELSNSASKTSILIESDEEEEQVQGEVIEKNVETADTDAVQSSNSATVTNEHNANDCDVIEIDDEDDEVAAVTEEKYESNIDNATDMDVDADADMNIIKNEHEKSNIVGTSIEEEMKTAKNEKDENEEKDEEDDEEEVFYNKECINFECKKKCNKYYRAPNFTSAFYKVQKKKTKTLFICDECYDYAVLKYEHYAGVLSAKKPLLLEELSQHRQEFVEISDSSDEEDTDISMDSIEKSLNECTISMVKKDLMPCIKSVLEICDIQNQLTLAKHILQTRANKIVEQNAEITEELRKLQKRSDCMNETFGSAVKIKYRSLTAWDLNTNRPFYLKDGDSLNSLLPTTELRYLPIQIFEVYYTVKKQSIGSWVECRVVERLDMQNCATKNMPHFKVKLLTGQQTTKVVPLKNLAYYHAPAARLPIGARVIAYFDGPFLMPGKEKVAVPSAFYPGIVAEPLQAKNKYRYLIFYDDGYTQYVQHRNVRLVCHESENPWDDVHVNSKEFIKKYINESTTNRPMVQTQKGHSMSVELNGKWTYGRVLAIDSSLVLMQFEGAKNYTEWIYRGSARLGPINREHKGEQQQTLTRMPRRTMPFVRYTEDEDSMINNQQAAAAAAAAANSSRAVARKSTTMNATTNLSNQNQMPTVKHLNNSTIYLEDDNKPKGKVVYYTAKRNIPPAKYKPHKCTPNCLIKITHNLNAYSPLAKPLLSGWERLIFRQKIKKVITYRGPCGKMLRNMRELHIYLRQTQNVLNVDNFDFNPEINCLAEYVIDISRVRNRDISNGQEKMAIPLVNYYDDSLPPECRYAAQRIPTKGVPLNLDKDFLSCCDCEDDCSNKDKCACWQLTLEGAKYGNPNTPIDEVGYQYKRLLEHVPTGIYECNSRCKCKSNCLNRVAQQPLQMKLQVFKTSNRGWGLRCLNDISRGSFICIYAGYLLNEATANEDGKDANDEYFAELDYIEVAEQIKDGYESDVNRPMDDDEEEEVYAPDLEDDDDDFRPSKSFMTRSRRAARENEAQERQPRNFAPNQDMDNTSVPETSIRRFFGKDETCYIMDAKITGNLGRYFNHSCSPNLFVQNVLVDTHDLRFPWVAFFASTNIRAGTELTWNYNYEVGVVPGKVLYCQCGASNCRIRLL